MDNFRGDSWEKTFPSLEVKYHAKLGMAGLDSQIAENKCAAVCRRIRLRLQMAVILLQRN
jgi:hypothetical protein